MYRKVTIASAIRFTGLGSARWQRSSPCSCARSRRQNIAVRVQREAAGHAHEACLPAVRTGIDEAAGLRGVGGGHFDPFRRPVVEYLIQRRPAGVRDGAVQDGLPAHLCTGMIDCSPRRGGHAARVHRSSSTIVSAFAARRFRHMVLPAPASRRCARCFSQRREPFRLRGNRGCCRRSSPATGHDAVMCGAESLQRTGRRTCPAALVRPDGLNHVRLRPGDADAKLRITRHPGKDGQTRHSDLVPSMNRDYRNGRGDTSERTLDTCWSKFTAPNARGSSIRAILNVTILGCRTACERAPPPHSLAFEPPSTFLPSPLALRSTSTTRTLASRPGLRHRFSSLDEPAHAAPHEGSGPMCIGYSNKRRQANFGARSSGGPNSAVSLRITRRRCGKFVLA